MNARGARARAGCAARDLWCVGGSGREPPTQWREPGGARAGRRRRQWRGDGV